MVYKLLRNQGYNPFTSRLLNSWDIQACKLYGYSPNKASYRSESLHFLVPETLDDEKIITKQVRPHQIHGVFAYEVGPGSSYKSIILFNGRNPNTTTWDVKNPCK